MADVALIFRISETHRLRHCAISVIEDVTPTETHKGLYKIMLEGGYDSDISVTGLNATDLQFLRDNINVVLAMAALKIDVDQMREGDEDGDTGTHN